MNDADACARAYAAAFEALTPETVERLRPLVHAGIRFEDPFNRIDGVDPFLGLFHHMYSATEAPRFAIRHVATEGRTALILWDFTARVRRPRLELAFAGVSEVAIDEAGLVTRHIDYWDPAAALYEKLPAIGAPLRWLRRRLAAR